MQVPVYKILDIYDNCDDQKNDIKAIITEMMKEINKQEDYDFYYSQGTNSNFNFMGFKVSVYYKNHRYKPDWVDFYKSVVDDQKIEKNGSSLLQAKNVNNSVVCFIYNNESIYAICNGYGSNSIAKYCDPLFGLYISSKLGYPISSIKSLKENDITGNVLAATQIFRNDHILIETDGIGKLYKEIDYKIDNEFIYKKIKIGKVLKGGKIKKGSCGVRVGSSYKLKKGLNFKDVLKLLSYFESVKNNDSEYELTNLVRLNQRNKKDKETINELIKKMKTMIFESFRDGKLIDFQLIHNNFEAYNNAFEFEIYYNHKKDAVLHLEMQPHIYELKLLFEKDEKLISKEDFEDVFSKLRIITKDENGDYLTEGTLEAHIVGEIKLDKNVYFLIDNQWFSMKNTLVESLDKDVKKLIKNIEINKKKLVKWVSGIEDDYNGSFVDKKNFYVLHKILYNNIEIADFIEVHKNKVIFYHVKKGFDASMRDLSSQINNSARIVQNSMLSNEHQFDFAKKLYKTLESRKKSDNRYYKKVAKQTDLINEDDFINLFKDKEIEYCLVIHHSGSISLPEKSKSCIAKFSLIELINRMNSYRIPLSIEEV